MERDLHVHTFFSPCAEPAMSLPAILEAAAAAGVAEVGLADHPHRPGLARHHRMLDRAREVQRGPVHVWIGAEIEVVGFRQLALPPAELPDADYILAAASHYDVLHAPPVPHLEDPVEWADRLMTDLENAVGSGAHVIAHPFYAYALLHPPAGVHVAPMDDVLAEIRLPRLHRWLESVAEAGMALEIGPRLCVHLGLESFIENAYRQARQLGVRFSTGSDAHRPGAVGVLGQAEYLMRRIGITDRDLWSPTLVCRARRGM
ncbi:MAG: PHP domain-containing protein [Kiritimatiellae bacterium]|nr:PHP domain-containing protein [Kiritimatiellia bacterium]